MFSKRLNSLHRRAVKFACPETTLTTDQKLKEMGIYEHIHKQGEYKKDLFIYRVLNEAPKYYYYLLIAFV